MVKSTHKDPNAGFRSRALMSVSEGPPEALGESDAFLDFQERLSRVAPVDRPVLLVGERGTGKELATARLHFLSRRWQGPFVEVNCAALAPSLLETELFGHEEGAFTGARGRRAGRFEAADGGTLFLDEIGLIPMEVQEKILRVVEYRSFQRVGSSESVCVDVRIIGATNADLPALSQSGDFKQDLLDRLSFEVLFVPPLRARHGDVLILARHFAARMALELGRGEMPQFSLEAERALEGHSWPGNIRELKNVVERAVYRSPNARVSEIEFDPFRAPKGWMAPTTGERIPGVAEAAEETVSPTGGPDFRLGGNSLEEAVARFERDAIRQALEKSRHHQGRAAASLGLSYHQFRGLYRKYRAELG